MKPCFSLKYNGEIINSKEQISKRRTFLEKTRKH